MLFETLQTARSLLSGKEGDVDIEIGHAGARLFQNTQPSAIEAQSYFPAICLILQGAKDVEAGTISVSCPEGHAIIISHDLPVLARITQASPQAPYIAIVLPLDLDVLRGFRDELSEFTIGKEPEGALSTYLADLELVDAFGRFLKMVRDDHFAQIFNPILLREIHARVLFSPHGAILRRILELDDTSAHVARAIALIRNSLDKPLSIAALAKHAGMSKSSFHDHFKAVTGITPNQYQKDIRLLEGRRLITSSDMSMSSIAFEIGYKSPSQFSRDYADKFGRAPREDRKLVR